jgi:hydrogenase maturation protease
VAAVHEPMLVAAVGNRWLADMGFGVHVVERLQTTTLPPNVDLASWECGSITAFQRLGERRYRRAIFVAAIARGRPPGTLHQLHEHLPLPDEAEIHGRVGDAVMGLVCLDNLLFIGRYYGCVPDELLLIEAEPADDTWGDRLSPDLAALVDPAVEAIVAALRTWSEQ